MSAMISESDSASQLCAESGFKCRTELRRHVARLLTCIAAIMVVAHGCHIAPKATFSADRPSQHSVTTKHFVIHSDVKIEHGDAIVQELQELQHQITSTLQLPQQRDPVAIYLFSDEVTYRYYMQNTWSNLPPRRAYFVGTSRELAVYSYRSPRMQEDLRHEFTHGVLHACLTTVPLWLDEGLAEYFELRGGEPGIPHAEHLAELRKARDEGWGPKLYQLEMINDFRNLTQRDYAESWAWVHFLLHQDAAGRQVLLNYVAELRAATIPGKLLPTLEKALPNYYPAMLSHVAQLYATTTLTAHRGD